MKRRSERNEEVGVKYGRLTVLSVHFDGRYWRTECQCDCGNKCTPALGDIKKKKHATTSCGCYAAEVASISHSLHGHAVHGSESKEYGAWASMKSRCYRTRDDSFSKYGGRGIVVCDRWINSFENFFSDMGIKPTSQHSLDRIDVNGPYSPENCKWSTVIEQCNNRRSNVKLEFNGEMLTAPEISRRLGFPRHTITARMREGMTLHQAIHHKKYSPNRVS